MRNSNVPKYKVILKLSKNVTKSNKKNRNCDVIKLRHCDVIKLHHNDEQRQRNCKIISKHNSNVTTSNK